MTQQDATNHSRHPKANPPRNGETPHSTRASKTTRAPRRELTAKTILGILREQGIPDSEARRRVNSDPSLHGQLD